MQNLAQCIDMNKVVNYTGLTRVRGFTQDDAHIFCTPEQLDQEFKNVIDLVLYVFTSLGFKNFTAQVSVRDHETPEKYIGGKENWEKAEQAIINAAKDKELDFVIENLEKQHSMDLN